MRAGLPTIKKDKKSAVYGLAVYDIRQFTLQEDWEKMKMNEQPLTDIYIYRKADFLTAGEVSKAVF